MTNNSIIIMIAKLCSTFNKIDDVLQCTFFKKKRKTLKWKKENWTKKELWTEKVNRNKNYALNRNKRWQIKIKGNLKFTPIKVMTEKSFALPKIEGHVGSGHNCAFNVVINKQIDNNDPINLIRSNLFFSKCSFFLGQSS